MVFGGYDGVVGLGLGENHSLSFHDPENTDSHYFDDFGVPSNNFYSCTMHLDAIKSFILSN